MADESLLKVEQVTRRYKTRRGVVTSLDGVSLTVSAGRSVGIVGESGSGKSTLARLVVGLEHPNEGRVMLEGVDIGTLRGDKEREARAHVGLVLQDPWGSLDPRLPVSKSVEEPLVIHRRGRSRDRMERVAEILDEVGLATHLAGRRPAALSGGERQRVAIARALVLEPDLLVLDEPVSALDVSVQAQVLSLLVRLREAADATYIFISHDLGVIRHVVDEVAVMFLGRVVERGAARELLRDPLHPYTIALVSSSMEAGGRERVVLEGDPPSPLDIPTGCRFRSRCFRATDRCALEDPPLIEAEPGRAVACHFSGRFGSQAADAAASRGAKPEDTPPTDRHYQTGGEG